MARARLESGIELEYEVMGQGEPVMLIAGVTNQLVHWPEAFCQQLVDKGYQVIRFDNRDAGKSTSFRDKSCPGLPSQIFRFLVGLQIESPYTLDDMADDVVGLQDHLGIESAHIIGLSMGGMIAQVLSLNHPERVRSLGLIMTSPGGLYMPQITALHALISSPASLELDALLAHNLNVTKVLSGPHYELDVPFVDGMYLSARERDPVDDCFPRQFSAILASPARHEMLQKLDVPTLIVHGDADPLIPIQAGRDLAEAIPGSELMVLENVGHNLPICLWPKIIERLVQNMALEDQQQDAPAQRLAA